MRKITSACITSITGLDTAPEPMPSSSAATEDAWQSRVQWSTLFEPKPVRTSFGSNNVDHCTRLCHASSVTAQLEGIGSGAVSNPVMDVMQAEVIFLIGANPVVNHPVAATWMKNAVK